MPFDRDLNRYLFLYSYGWTLYTSGSPRALGANVLALG